MHRQHNRTPVRHPSPRLLARPLALALHLIFGGGAGLGAAALPVPAMAQTPNAAREFDIPAGPLGATLNRIGESAGLVLSFDPALIRGKTAPTVKGRLTAQQALDQVLAGNGLTASADGVSIVIKAAPPVVQGAKEVTLPVVTVKAGAERETATGPVVGYVAKRSVTATKTDTPLIETPQSVSVIGAEEIENRRADALVDALNYTAGAIRTDAQDRTTDTFNLRGFDMNPQSGSYYRDGTKYTVNKYNGRQELYGLERVEVLKGASSVLYGTAAPGGIINTVSKRPTTVALREVNAELGSFGRKQISADFSGALTDGGTWSYRLIALKRSSDSYVDFVPDDRTYLAPALKWQPDAATSFTLLSEYQRDHTAFAYGFPAEGTVLPNPNGVISRARFPGEPGHDRFDLTKYSIGYLFEHAFSDQLQLRHSLRYFKADNIFDHTWIWGLDADNRTTLERGAQDRTDRSAAVTTDTSLQYKWTSGSIVHTSIAGFDVTSQRHESERYNRTIQSLDLYSPAYGGLLGEPAVNSSSWKSKTRQLGLYVQDQLKIADRWIVLLGGRQDWVRYDEKEFFSRDVTADNEKSSAFTGRAGLVYLAANGLAPYASFSQSFVPQSGSSRFGNRFKPTRGEQWELGVRYQPTGLNTLISVAVYDLTETNVLVTDPENEDYSIQHGKARSRGLELETKTKIGRHTNLIAAYAYTDARTIKSSPLTPEEEGKRISTIPYNQISVWADYNFGAFGLAGLKLGGGVRHIGATRGEGQGAEVRVPSYLLLDMVVSYSTGPWRFAVNASNLTDKTYVSQCKYDCYFGEPRKVTGAVSYRW